MPWSSDAAAQHYRELLEINRLITSSLDPLVVLTTVAKQAARLLHAQAAALLLREDGVLRVVAAQGFAAPMIDTRLPLDREVMAAIRELGRAEALPTYVGVPLVLRGETIGILAVYRRADQPPGSDDEELLSALADQSAIAFDNARVHHQSQAQAEALRENEERFRLALDEAPIGVALVGLDGRFLRVNNVLCEMVGYSRDELRARTFQDITHPEDLDIDLALAQQLASGDIPRYQLAKRYIHKTGAIVHIQLSGSIVRKPDGTPLYFIAHLEDVTARIQVERERERLVRRLQTVLDEAPVGIIVTYDGSSWQANERAQLLFGRPLAGPVESCVLLDSFLDVDGRPLPREQFPGIRALRGEDLEAEEMRLRRPDGGLVPVLVNAAPILRRDETDLPGAVIAFEDITSHKELERLRSEWSSVVAHDLRQPLYSITMAAEYAADQVMDNPAVQRRIQHIRDAARRLGRMIQDLLDFSRLEARQLRLERRVVDAAELVQDVTDRLRWEAPTRLFAVDVHGAPACVDVDPDRFEQILENLLTNAIKYGDPNTPIIVEVERAAQTVMISVSNHGPGIAPALAPSLFQRFRTIEEAHQRGVKGLGLGLYITRELVEAHGGEITVESTPGEQTTFRFTLPSWAP